LDVDGPHDLRGYRVEDGAGSGTDPFATPPARNLRAFATPEPMHPFGVDVVALSN